MAFRFLKRLRIGSRLAPAGRWLRRAFYWVRDLIWPSLEPDSRPIPESAPVGWPGEATPSAEALESSYSLLKDELKVEDDRSKIVESKLQGILSLVPLAMTIVFAAVTLLTGEKAGAASRAVIVIEVAGAFYLSLQILRALVAVISGLSSRQYDYLRTEEIIPKQGETKEAYLNRACGNIYRMIRVNREVTNQKLNQLNLGHVAIRNAVWGLFLVIGALLTVRLLEMYS